MRRGWLDSLARVNATLAVLLFAALTVIVALQVFTRFVLHLPFIWSEEAARFLFFWVVLLGAALSVRTRRHFVIDITMGRAERWGRKGRFLFDVVPDLCVLAFSIFLLVQGAAYARIGLLRTATNSRVNMGLVYAAIPVFAALTIIYTASGLLSRRADLDGPPYGAGGGADGPAPGGTGGLAPGEAAGRRPPAGAE